jgi:small-conductance mechanosensitive channel
MKRFLPVFLLGVVLCLGFSACKEKKTKAELYAEREQQILNKMEKLRQRQVWIENKLVELESRLVLVRQRREQLENRWREPTPTPRPTRPPE